MAQKRGSGEAEDTGVALTDSALLVRAVLLLDDAAHVATLVAHDAPVSEGIGRLHRKHRGGRAGSLVRCDERLDGGRPDKRRVTTEHDDVALEALELVRRAHDRMTRAEHFELVRDDAIAEQGLDLLTTMANDYVNVFATSLACRIHNPTHKRLAQHLVGDLRFVGFHAGSSACCKNQSFSFHMRSH